MSCLSQLIISVLAHCYKNNAKLKILPVFFFIFKVHIYFCSAGQFGPNALRDDSKDQFGMRGDSKAQEQKPYQELNNQSQRFMDRLTERSDSTIKHFAHESGGNVYLMKALKNRNVNDFFFFQ